MIELKLKSSPRMKVIGECWVWQKAPTMYGYGSLYVKGSGNCRVHRLSYLLFKGPIHWSKVIDHVCRNRLCFNPDHLEAVPMSVNNERGFGWSGRNARKTHCKRGHEFNKENTMTRMRNGSPSRQCKKCYKILNKKGNDKTTEKRRLKRLEAIKNANS